MSVEKSCNKKEKSNVRVCVNVRNKTKDVKNGHFVSQMLAHYNVDLALGRWLIGTSELTKATLHRLSELQEALDDGR